MSARRMLRTLRLRAVFAAAVVLMVPAGGAIAQQGDSGQSIKGAELKGKAPVNREILRVKLPRAQEIKLSNGLPVLFLESHRVPTFSMQMVVLTGGVYDPAGKAGLASFTASLMREGTTKKNSRQIAEEVETLGASLSASAGLASLNSTVSVSGLVENFDALLELFAEVVKTPAFPADEVEKFKTRLLSQLQMQRADPEFLAEERFGRALYGDHPAALASPPPESIQALRREDLQQFHNAHYRPNNAMLAVVGDLTLAELKPKLEAMFAEWKATEAVPHVLPTVPDPPARRIYLIDRPDSVQTVFVLGNLGIERTHPDYFPLLVADKVLGGGPAARLFLNLREDKGYTYGAYSSFNTSKYRGVWRSEAEVRLEVTEGALSEFMSEFRRIREEAVPPVELENAKRALVGGFALSLEEPQILLQNIVTQRLFALPDDYWDTYPQKVAAVSAADVQRVARKYIDLERMQIVAVSDGSKVQSALEKFGSVTRYDAEGKPSHAE